MHKLKLIPIITLLLFSSFQGFSQLGFSHEIGVIAGPVQFRSDYGSRNNEETNFGNSGIGIGIVHYINFSYRADCNCYTTDTYFNDHFKLRSEISWNKTKLDHFGEWVAPDKVSPNADRLRAHSGEANNFDIGMQIEYFPKSIRSFQAFAYKFAPFVSLGVHYTAYSPKAATTYGDQDILNADNFYSYWEPGSVDPQNGSAFSMVTSVGVRYKLTVLSDLMLDLRWQLYFDDWIDGFNHQLRYNKYNDWLVWLNFGYIYYLD
ncbi:MAG: glutamate dehydrogenase [Bacteroidia bacterium]|nr:glutamate dehydrogenase [Bacteroidia bacterium]MBT8269593.1 glutamate dehydrogenase [Bacteroidia bacterium]NNF83251.1 glutamate dehydrogenase [Flavobacteriaceae bacterium]NNK69243.1 glutamate dehydrogenase [Flavobacteriaceae bacterium]